MEYLSLPFVLKDGYLEKTNQRESIMYSVGLILSSRIGSMRFDPDYGCTIWDKEFSDLMTANKADVRSTLRNAIDKYEKRLYNVSVSFLNLEGSVRRSLGITVKVSGNYKEEGEERRFDAIYNLG